ncbi:MAG TPA: transglycosylase SLT domain-containing protein [Blastocatellia bacterium]|nr:transglycosylase SLT domain-containing protein [Blastocatellia bacterium]
MGLYKPYTILWLSFLGEYFRLWVMRIRVVLIPSTAVLVISMSTDPARAEDKIQAFVNPNGKVVFTNLVDNTPTPVAGHTATDTVSQEMPGSLKALVDSISANHGVDAELVRAVMKTESNFNPRAVSNKGALGLMQLIPSTGRRYGVRDFFDPQQNIDGGVRYLKFLLEKFNGDLDLSLAAYNAGENLVERLGHIPAIPETTNYVRRVRAIYKKESTPVAIPSGSPAMTAVSAKAPSSKIYKTVDSRGVVHFSNIEPSN